jgi:serine/threonine protein kinase
MLPGTHRRPLLLQGVYHRDLQLSAVRLDACGGVVLTDFGYGAAKLSGSGEHADVRHRSATPAFTPPEVLLGHSIVNASYDGESLGEASNCAAGRPSGTSRANLSLQISMVLPVHCVLHGKLYYLHEGSQWRLPRTAVVRDMLCWPHLWYHMALALLYTGRLFANSATASSGIILKLDAWLCTAPAQWRCSSAPQSPTQQAAQTQSSLSIER